MTCTRGKFIFTLYLCHRRRSPLALRTFLYLLHASAVSSYEDAINRQSSDIGVAARHENRQRLEDAGGNGWGSAWVGKDPTMLLNPRRDSIEICTQMLLLCLSESRPPESPPRPRSTRSIPFGSVYLRDAGATGLSSISTADPRVSVNRRTAHIRERDRRDGDGLNGSWCLVHGVAGYDYDRSACSGCPLQAVSAYAQPQNNTESLRSPVLELRWCFCGCNQVIYLVGISPLKGLGRWRFLRVTPGSGSPRTQSPLVFRVSRNFPPVVVWSFDH
ncbi:hypothetical protein HYPSUDRAFT_201095 [Hypholoma sublateritium FD-334 SS-4]|uniref:Uncharacterized protein n=1 Tax=Hypholoma sublateritium (strain FD-334 SS-4) TaxID=945553 RepID=A0A0D2PVX9_HYPSF|nr:hypothetical protein HYPSUDRAFT_201095 [Hypholoma sublateritium FD-334 SS-4]